MLANSGDQHALVRTKAISDAMTDIATELRLIDVADLVVYIRAEQFANIHDLVNSSCELFFREGTLNFGWAADLDVRWGRPPAIRLDMEFRNLSVLVFFKLTLQCARNHVDILHIAFDPSAGTMEENTAHLVQAIADARLPSQTGRRYDDCSIGSFRA